MTADLAHDRRHGKRRELHPPVEVEPVDRLDQPDRADLDEILDGLAPVRIPAGERANERHQLLDETVTRGAVVIETIGLEEVDVSPAVSHQHHHRTPRSTSSSSQSRPAFWVDATRSTSGSMMRRRATSVVTPAESGPIPTDEAIRLHRQLELEAVADNRRANRLGRERELVDPVDRHLEARAQASEDERDDARPSWAGRHCEQNRLRHDVRDRHPCSG